MLLILLLGTRTRESHLLCHLFKVYALPIIHYAGLIYRPHSIRHVNLVESVQRRSTERLPQFYRFRKSYGELLKVLGLEIVEMRLLKQALCFVYKFIYGFIDLEVKEFFTFSARLYDLCSTSLKFNLERFITSQRKFSFR